MPQALPFIQAALPLIEKLLPIIEKFLNLNSSNSNSYSNGSKPLDQYLKETNKNLQNLQDKLQLKGVSGFEITGKITTAQDARDVATELQKILDDLPANSSAAKDLRAEISALNKAAVELDKRGQSGSAADQGRVVQNNSSLPDRPNAVLI
jgi:hypothetical protein